MAIPNHPDEASRKPVNWPEMLEAARKGDGTALGLLCEHLREYVSLVAAAGLNRGLRAKVDPSDIVQQSFMEAQTGIGEFRGTSELEFRTWLVRLVEHNLLDVHRHYQQARRRNVSREVPFAPQQYVSPQPTASSILLKRERDEQLASAVAMLPERRRQIIELRHQHRLGFAEIGLQLNISEAAARQLWVRTVNELRKALTEGREARPPQPR